MLHMLERIAELEALTRTLEPAAATRAALLDAAAGYAEDWIERLPDLPGHVPDDAAGLEALLASPLSEQPADMREALSVLWEGVDRLGVNEGAGHFFGFIPGPGLYTAAIGDYLAAVTGRYAGITYGAPGSVRLQQMLLRWVGSFLGYPEDSGGDLTSGGSVANLSAIVSAREAAGLRAADSSRAVVYVTEQTHHSVGKALRIAGLGEAVLRFVPVDGAFRMRADACEAMIAADRTAGLRPWLLVASAGSTDSGAVDPLESLADVAKAHEVTLHVDAAYGGAFALCAEGRRVLGGIERSDSVVVDPHKGLFVPFGTGLVLVKDREAMVRAHSYQAPYLRDADEISGLVSPADVSPELTRHNRTLRLWLPLKLHGVAAFRAALEEKLLLARYFHQRMGELDRFAVGPPPDLSVVTFRLASVRSGSDEANRALARAIQQDGRIYISTTVLDGKVTLRLAVLNVRTHREHVERAIEVIVELAEAIDV